MILLCSIGLLTRERAQAAFRVVYYKLKHGEWRSPIKPLSDEVKELAALVTERCILFVAPLYERFRDGTGTTDEDLKAWAKNNPDAAKLDLKGLTSLTYDGIAQVIKMLPKLKTRTLTSGSRFDMSAVVVDRKRSNLNHLDAVTIAAALPGSKVTELNLGENNIGDGGARAIATALPGSRFPRSPSKATTSATRAPARSRPRSPKPPLQAQLTATKSATRALA